MLLIGNGTLITNNDSNPLITDGCVVIEGGRIVDFGKTGAMRSAYKGDFIDAQERLIMSGFINAHTHFYSAMARGMPTLSAKPSKNFGDILNNLWWPLDEGLTMEDIRYSALIGGIECIKNGVTTVFDHHAGYGAIRGSLNTIAEALSSLGLRASLCYEVSERGGKKALEAAIEENTDFAKTVQSRFGDRFSALFGLHASFTLSDAALEECAVAASAAGTGFHVHVAEGSEDLAHAKSHGYKGVVDRLVNFGIFGHKTIAVHCIHVCEDELEQLCKTDTFVVHNPQSNMGNAVGCSRVPEMIARGIPVGLGTDGYTADMLASMKTANILHKHRLGDPSVMWGEPPAMLFKNNRTLVSRHFSGNIGIIAKGAVADVITVNYIPPTPLDESNIYSHLHFGIQGSDVWDVIAGGRQVMRARVLTVLDEAEILARARELSASLWKRLAAN